MPSIGSFPANCGACSITGLAGATVVDFLKAYKACYAGHSFQPGLVVFSDGWDPKTSDPGHGGRAIARDLVHYGKVVESDEALGTHGTPIKGWLWNPSKVWLEAGMPLDLHLSQEELDKIRAKEKASKLEPGETLKWEQRLATSVADRGPLVVPLVKKRILRKGFR